MREVCRRLGPFPTVRQGKLMFYADAARISSIRFRTRRKYRRRPRRASEGAVADRSLRCCRLRLPAADVNMPANRLSDHPVTHNVELKSGGGTSTPPPTPARDTCLAAVAPHAALRARGAEAVRPGAGGVRGGRRDFRAPLSGALRSRARVNTGSTTNIRAAPSCRPADRTSCSPARWTGCRTKTG